MNESILFIDDDVDFLTLLEKLLSLEGYKVFQASNGPEGLHLAYERHPDLIILDVSMPGRMVSKFAEIYVKSQMFQF